MPRVVGIIFLLLAAWAVFSLYFGREAPDENPGVLAARPDTSIYAAPVNCGPYFLYIHPAYYKLDRFHRRAQRYVIFSVSKTPPEARVETIEQLWAYGLSQNTLASERPNLFGREVHSRTAMRPAMFKEIGIGDYLGEYICKPYRPFTLQCTDFAPWCDLARSKPRTPPRGPAKYVPPEFR